MTQRRGDEVAVTGGGGFIGRAVVAELRKRGLVPRILDKAHGHDVRDERLAEWVGGCTGVIHLAGVLGTSELWDPALGAEAISVNLAGELNVLHAARAVGAHVVNITLPETSAWPSLYRVTKVAARDLAASFITAFGTRVTHVRAWNAYGPGQAVGPGHPRKLIPALAVEGWRRVPLTIWGDGEQTVDLVWVGDVARLLVDGLARPGRGEVIDAGTGTPVTVNTVASWVLRWTGSTAGVEHRPMRVGELERTHLAATGEGWPSSEDWRAPELDMVRLKETVASYRVAAAAGIVP